MSAEEAAKQLQAEKELMLQGMPEDASMIQGQGAMLSTAEDSDNRVSSYTLGNSGHL